MSKREIVKSKRLKLTIECHTLNQFCIYAEHIEGAESQMVPSNSVLFKCRMIQHDQVPSGVKVPSEQRIQVPSDTKCRVDKRSSSTERYQVPSESVFKCRVTSSAE